MNTNTNTNNVLPQLKTPSIFYPFIALIVLLIIVLICLIYNVPNLFKSNVNKSQQEIIADVFIVLFVTLIIFTVCISLLPNFKDIKGLFLQITNVTYVILYTIFLILFFTMMPSDTLNNYAYIITPITAALGALTFYKGSTSNYVEKFSVNYERIKTMILLFCF